MGSSSSTAGRPHTSLAARMIQSPNQQVGAPPAYGAAHTLQPPQGGAADPRRHSMLASYHYPSTVPQQVVHPQMRTDYPGRQVGV